jgi:hypothetical protein
MFLSSAIPLYLKNREDLGYQYLVLWPFGLATLTTAAVVGMLLLMLRKQSRLVPCLWGYYFCGLAALPYMSAREMALPVVADMSLLAILALLVIVLAVVFGRRFSVEGGARFFAVLTVAFVSLDAAKLIQARGEEPSLDNVEFAALRAPENTPPDARQRPNVYHLLFDEYQTDMFLQTLTPAVKDQLPGFVLFPQTTTYFGRTAMSLASVFSGRTYDFGSSQDEYNRAAFESDRSILYWLKQAGYETRAYLHPVYAFEQTLFDNRRFHKNADSYSLPAATRLFAQLWTYSALPRPLSARLLPASEMEQFDNQNVLSFKAPLNSYYAFRNYLEEEASFSPQARYTFVHLLLPHFPYIMTEDCGFSTDGARTSAMQQSQCATSLIVQFANRLKALGRYDDAMIIVQADHGARFVVRRNKLVNVGGRGVYSNIWSRARSRALLLMKPPGQGAERTFRSSEIPASLLDIAATVRETLDLQGPRPTDGQNLLGPDSEISERKRYYHFFDKKGPEEWTDDMHRYEINGDRIKLLGIVKLENNPKPGMNND